MLPVPPRRPTPPVVPVARLANCAEREAQADVVITRQLKQKAVRPERRKDNRQDSMRRRKGDR